MLHTTAVVYPDKSPELRAQVELDLEDLLPPDRGLMPVSFIGRFLNLGASEGAAIRSARTVEMLFAGTALRYEAIINRETLHFRAIDTGERGI